MAKYANQKTFKINRTNPIKEKKQYLAISCESISEASRNLGEAAFKFYMYLCCNADGYQFDYSPQHFANIYGLSVDRARKVVQQLVDARYLVLNDNGIYEFYEVPQEEKLAIEENFELPEEEKRLMKTKSGAYAPITYAALYEGLKGKQPDGTIEKIWNSLEVA